MKKDILKETAVKKWGLPAAALFVCASIGLLAYAQPGADTSAPDNGQTETTEEVSSGSVPELSEDDLERLSKEETVYVIADASGSTRKLIVSDHLKNIIGSGSVSDETSLTGITNLKGSEDFQQDANGLLNWNARGDDIYYSGTIEKELPIELHISYLLDGQEISPEDLAGRSGHVTIRFDYTNRQKETVVAGDEALELYVPFVTVTGFVLDNDHFRNIEMTNGRIIDDGSRTIAVGYAVPGLADNLKIDSEEFSDELDIPEYVELEADVTDFELTATMTVAENKLFGEMELDEDGKLDELSDDMDELQDAMNELMDGTGELYDGVLELYDGSQELVDGIDELYDGTGELYDGTEDLYDGSDELHEGVKELCAGLSQLTGNNAALQKGATEVFETLIGTVKLKLNESAATLSTAAETLKGKPEIASLLKGAAGTLQSSAGNMTADNYAEILEQLGAALDGLKEDIQKAAASMTGMSTNSPFRGKFCSLSAENISEPQRTADETPAEGGSAEDEYAVREPEEEAAEEVQAEQEHAEEVPAEEPEAKGPEEAEEEPSSADDTAGGSEDPQADAYMEISPEKIASLPQVSPLPAASAAVPQEQVSELISQLDAAKGELASARVSLDKYKVFYQGLLQYLAGVSQAEQGADKLHDGSHELRNGAGELRDGALELRDGTGELKDGGQELNDGVIELKDGSKELDDGAHEFNEDGIQKLADVFDGDLQELKDRLDGTKAAALTYRSFSGISEEMDGDVRFIYKTDGIEK